MGASHYPAFDVLKEKDAWDEYSRSIVLQRLKPAQPTFLKEHEIRQLRAVSENLLYESRREILDFVVAHIDKQLGSPIGESERKVTVPPQDVLVRRGLEALNASTLAAAGCTFDTCAAQLQAETLQALQKGHAALPPEFADIPQKDLFKKLLRLAVDALASHPTIWTEIGYPGPAYPRGYYRIERGVHDPWEPVALPLPKQSGANNGAN